jgi:hypothetical protein
MPLEAITYFLQIHGLQYLGQAFDDDADGLKKLDLTGSSLYRGGDHQIFLAAVAIHPSLLVLADFPLTGQNINHAAGMIQQNIFLRCVSFYLDEVDSNLLMLPIVTALARNSTLTKLGFYNAEAPFGEDNIDLFLTLLKTQNFTLANVNFEYDAMNVKAQEKRAKMDFYLELNREFRRDHLLGNRRRTAASTEDWLNVIISARNKPQVVFYYLSCNPQLVHGVHHD